jgi:hypothetical protein
VTRAVIVSRTRMRSGVCVGGFLREERVNVRLLPAPGEHAWPDSVPFAIGEVWELELARAPVVEPPHVEDHIVDAHRRVAVQSGLGRWLAANARVWEGDASALFDGLLRFTPNGAGYIGRDRVSAVSVGFWRPDHDVRLTGVDHPKYEARAGNRVVHIAYVGTEEVRDVIPAGCLTRVSLSRWKHLAGVEGCWLQVSGSYPDGHASSR